MNSRLLGMSFILGLIFSALTAAVSSPFDEYLDLVDADVASVESLRREIRQPVQDSLGSEVADLLVVNKPKKMSKRNKEINNVSGKSDEGGYYRTYGSDADGEKGYDEQIHSKGDHGYKTLDTFHKVNGDNYGFEEHTAFGNAQGGDKGGHRGKSVSHGKSKDGDHEGAGTFFESYYAEDDGDHAGYADGGDEHYEEEGGGDGSYEHLEGYSGHSENYKSDDDGDGEDGGSHSSYTSGEEGGDYY